MLPVAAGLLFNACDMLWILSSSGKYTESCRRRSGHNDLWLVILGWFVQYWPPVGNKQGPGATVSTGGRAGTDCMTRPPRSIDRCFDRTAFLLLLPSTISIVLSDLYSANCCRPQRSVSSTSTIAASVTPIISEVFEKKDAYLSAAGRFSKL